jgi:hypothetical protein
MTCSDSTSTTSETCDGSDNDCDTVVDNNLPLGPTCDGPDSDSCGEGNFICLGGFTVCSDVTAGTAEICNGVDDDCDTVVDEGLVGTSCDGPDSDFCLEGISSCVAGLWTCSDATGTDSEVCDGADNDCDTTIDEGCTAGWTFFASLIAPLGWQVHAWWDDPTPNSAYSMTDLPLVTPVSFAVSGVVQLHAYNPVLDTWAPYTAGQSAAAAGFSVVRFDTIDVTAFCVVGPDIYGHLNLLCPVP